jgi:putative transposase
MPRKARIDAPGALHHIILRGIDRTAIFRDDTDCENFLARLSRLLIESSKLAGPHFAAWINKSA